MHADTRKYNLAQAPNDRAICDLLADQIDCALPEAENRIWHAHPVWFLDGNPIVGHSKLKDCVRLLFWSGQFFQEQRLQEEGSFKAAEARFNAVDQVDTGKLARWPSLETSSGTTRTWPVARDDSRDWVDRNDCRLTDGGTLSIKSVGGVPVLPKHRLTCHCGAVVIELDLPDGIVDPRRCDCSICRRKGAVVASVPLSGIRIVQGEEHLRLYQFNTRVARHYFCGVCGIYTHHQRRSFPNQYGYNVGCLEGINPFLLGEVPVNDGVNHPADRAAPGTA